MKILDGSFNTRVARRIFTLFIICSILPVSIFGIISYIHVRTQLINQGNITLQLESKSLALSFYEKLDFLRSELRFIDAFYQINPDDLNAGRSGILAGKIEEYFQALAILNDDKLRNVYGEIEQPLQISREEWDYLRSGKVLLSRQYIAGKPSGLFMCLALNTAASGQDVLIGKINQEFIFDVEERKPPLTELFITDRSDSLLFSSIRGFSSSADLFDKEASVSPSGNFDWQYGDHDYIACYSSLFLKPNFYFNEWIVVLAELKSDVLTPMRNFKNFFTFTMVFTLGMVFFLSINLIQRNMVPIEVLKEATRKISEGSFGHRVNIESGDEFESLGRDFNEMSSKLKESQDLLINAAKMSTMGQMAAGIMHEIKQPLTAIYGNIELALLGISNENSTRDRLKIVLKAVDRLNSILEKFRSFSSRPKEIVGDVSLNHTVHQIYELMEHELRLKNINCVMEIEDNLSPVLGDEQELQQVISNLMVNARDALEDNDNNDRRIVIKTASSEEKVYLSIDDNGSGIPEDIRDRIFDPFFTTKSSDKGTGLGMAIIQSILHHHNAVINLESEAGKGTKFTITFPKSGYAQEVL